MRFMFTYRTIDLTSYIPEKAFSYQGDIDWGEWVPRIALGEDKAKFKESLVA